MSERPLVWIITGTSSGIGREITLAALKRGDHVIATARPQSMSKLDDLEVLGADILELDVTDSCEKLQQIANRAVEIHGRVDIVVNNAGKRIPYSTNFFGGVNVARAFLPFMRKERTGTIVWIGSTLGWTPSVLGSGMYSATKAAMRVISQSLNAEISHLGLRSIHVDLGWFRTAVCSPTNLITSASRIADYDSLMAPVRAQLNSFDRTQPGDPVKGAEILVDLVRGEGVAKGREVPPVIGLGQDYYLSVKQACKNTLEELEEWQAVSCSTDIEPAAFP
ncbi:NAD-P-binding protein [Sparassis latifolia]